MIWLSVYRDRFIVHFLLWKFYFKSLRFCGGITISTSTSLKAVKSASCLQLPKQGDVVLIQGFDESSSYIMAILETKSHVDDPVVYEFSENSVIKGEKLVFNTDAFAVQSSTMSFDTTKYNINTYLYNATMVSYEMNSTTIKQFSHQWEVVAETSTSSFVNSVRFVRDTDRVKAMNINYSSEAVSKLTGNVTMINGYELYKSDGKLMMVG